MRPLTDQETDFVKRQPERNNQIDPEARNVFQGLIIGIVFGLSFWAVVILLYYHFY